MIALATLSNAVSAQQWVARVSLKQYHLTRKHSCLDPSAKCCVRLGNVRNARFLHSYKPQTYCWGTCDNVYDRCNADTFLPDMTCMWCYQCPP